MSKYSSKVVELNKEKDSIIIQAEESSAILSADLQAQIMTQQGVIIRKQSALKKAEADVERAEYYLTNDIDTYLSNLNGKWQLRDKIAADLDLAEITLEKLQEVVKLFV